MQCDRSRSDCRRDCLENARRSSRWPGMTMLAMCSILVVMPAVCALVEGKKGVVIRAAGEELDTSTVASLKPRSMLSMTWIGLLGSLRGLAASHRTDIRQWYVVVEDTARLQRLSKESGLAFGMKVADGTYAATGSEEMARKLAGLDGVRWVNERPKSHKVDKGLRGFKQPDRRAEGKDLTQEHDAVQLKKLLVLLIPRPQQHSSAKVSAEDFKSFCEHEFSAKRWEVEVTVINEKKLLLHMREPERAVPGAVRTSTLEVVDWLADQWQVQWLEPKGMYKPMARYSSKLMTMGDFSGKYNSDAAQQLLTNTLTSSVQTASWEVTSVGGAQSGRFCFWHNDMMVIGRNGTDGAFLSPVATAKARVDGTGYTTNAGLMVTTIHMNSTSPFAEEADWYAGMQVQIGSEYRMVSSYQPATATITIHPAIEGPVRPGTDLQIWIVVQPGDQITVMADAERWQGSLRQDWLPPDQRIHVSCPMAATPLEDRIPGLMWDWGVRSLRQTCTQMEEQTATVRVPSPEDLTEESAAEECMALCPTETARELLEKQQVCVSNLTKITYSGAFGQTDAGGSGPWWCECTYRGAVPWVLRLTVPEANPLWEAGLSGSGQIVALADTGLDTGNCLLSEEEGATPAPEGEVDTERDKVVGVLRNTVCELCEGCSKLIAGDRWTFFGTDAELFPPSETSPGRPIWAFAWPHRCENTASRTPTGCDLEADDAMLEPRRYSQLGARLELGLSVSLPPPFETVPGRVKLYVLAREDYEEHRSNITALDANRHLCMNAGCGEPVETVEFVGETALALPPSRRGYGIVIAAAGENTAKISNQLSGGSAGLQFYSAEIACGDYGDDAQGHGTFCGGVIAGELAGGVAGGGGVGTRGERTAAKNHEGIAKDAKLLVFDLSSGVDGVENLTVPLDLERGLLQPVWDAGARVISNSWSCLFPQILCDVNECQYTAEDHCNEYGTASFELDNFVWEHPDMLVVVPVGDSSPPAGRSSAGSLRAPATCKNCISVGASHSWHATLSEALKNVDAMDGLSAPLESKRLMCPRQSFQPPERWPQNLGVSIPSTADGGDAPLLDGEVAGWPAEPAECCNTDPDHNTAIEILVADYQVLIDFNLEQNKQATADQYALQQDAEKAKLYPCRPEPNCCLVQDSFCCIDNYRGPDAAASPPNSLRPTRFDINSVVATSARGPANDGVDPPTRFKPDLVAPGAFLVAANSHGTPAEAHCGLPPRTDEPFDENAAVVAMSGTSVATAVVAGSAAIVRQYFADGWHPSGSPREEDKLEVSAALVKACLLTGSQSVSRDGGSAGRTSQVPNHVEGWGRPSLMRLLFLKDSGMDNRRLWVVDETVGFEVQGWVHEYEFLVDMSSDRVDLAITLTWTDPAATPGSGFVLVNDLDLAASDEGSVGWVNGRVCDIDPFTETFSEDCPKPIPDRDNTVEKTDFWVQHKQVCTYGKGSRVEYGGCFRENELGKLRSQERDRGPSTVKVRVIAARVTEECVSDGFYSTCSTRRQPYALVVSGPLLARQADGSLVPPIFSSYAVGSGPPKDLDGAAAPIAQASSGNATAGDAPSNARRLNFSIWWTALGAGLLAIRLGGRGLR